MSAQLQWMSVDQFSLNSLGDTLSGKATSYFNGLNCNAEKDIGTCERKGLSIYVDLSFSSEASFGADTTDIGNELKAVSMEPKAMEPQNGLQGACKGGSSQEGLQTNGLTSHTDSLSGGFKGGKAFEATHIVEGNSLKDLSSVEAGLKMVTKQSLVETKGQGSLSMKQAARQCHQRFDQKQPVKRVGTPLEREMSQQKKLRLTTSKVVPVKNEKDGFKTPAVIVPDESGSRRKSKSLDENEVEALAKRGDDVVSVVNSADPAALSRAQPKPRARDITKEEAAFEFQQCVSLLRKYGVLNTREYYLSQSFPSCAPHPGFVGDKCLSKRCKICRVLEDTNSTVICDDCQESFHLSCCLPRLNPKHFDREDHWYCSVCRKQKRRMGRFYDIGRADGSSNPAGTSFISKVKLGTAYQANVPLWTGRADHSSNGDLFGMEEPLSEVAKEKERYRLLSEFAIKAEKWRKQSANNSCVGTPENWLKCHSVLVKPFRDYNGHKHSEVICGKWRRAPLNIQQFERWECFCAIEWDPRHADCAVPQELPTEEILRRMQVMQDLQPNQVPKEEP